MAQNTNKTIAAGSWTQLTDADITSITFQNAGDDRIFVKGTADATEPTDLNGAVGYNPWQGERNVALSDLFPGISAVRVWAYCPEDATVVVSHA